MFIMKNQNKRYVLWAVAVVVVIGAIFGVVKLAAKSKINNEAYIATTVLAISDADHFKGNKDSKVNLVEYSDFQCPACGSYYPLLKKVNEDYKAKIKFAYRHFPLPQHQNAKLAATVAEAAGNQGKFWEMHDMIFENQNDWAEAKDASAYFIKYAMALKLDLEKFKNDLSSEAIKNKIENDSKGGAEAGVNQTPTFFLNGKKLNYPQDYNEFKTILDQSISQQ